MTAPEHIAPGYRFVSRTQAATGTCKAGHDLSAPGGTRPRSANDPRVICVPCWEERRRWCAAGFHLLPERREGQKRVNCPQCLNTVRDRNMDRLPEYYRIEHPPDDVLDYAACSVEVAPLFDPRGDDEGTDKGTDHRQRVAWALAICSACPVAAECREWAVKNRLTGVYGGWDITQKMYKQWDEAKRLGTQCA